MHEPKTHFDQIPVETVKKIARELPEGNGIGDGAASAAKQDDGASQRERWRQVAQRVQLEEDPKKMIGLVQELIATFDDEQLHKRLPHNRGASKPSGDSGEGGS